MMIHLRSLSRRDWNPSFNGSFPFNLPVAQTIQTLEFTTPVTFFVGENGSGKSTLLEALACAVESITVGIESVKTDPCLAAQRELSKYFRLVWTKRTHKGFFLRAEDFFGYAKQQNGESFLALFQSRFVPGGLYLLDEPEAPLSPMRQLALIAMIKEMIAQDSQFIIATHSPILMAFPGATILSFDEGEIKPADYEDLESVRLMRDFLQNPGTFLQHL
ncbi:MAG: AAA family ATPase [Chloroflexi bacterium]|nr:AAA family ATPase [Chloroflexota bacterium]